MMYNLPRKCSVQELARKTCTSLSVTILLQNTIPSQILVSKYAYVTITDFYVACMFLCSIPKCMFYRDLSWDNIIYTQYNNKNTLWNKISSIKVQGSQNTKCLV